MNDTSAPLSDKSRISYILLGFFFGTLGIHNFYAGYKGRGIIQLLITLLSGGVLSWISSLWAIIDICITDKDGKGLKMS